jgi:thymidylate kinase
MSDKNYCFIFEGPDGSGKTTMAGAVFGELALVEFPSMSVGMVRQPGCTKIGEALRKIIVENHDISPEVRQLLCLANAMSVEPVLSDNFITILDRSFYVSSLVYGPIDGVPLSTLFKYFSIGTPRVADRVYFFECPVDICETRLGDKRAYSKDYFDTKPTDYQKNVHAAYRRISDPSVNSVAAEVKLLSYTVAETDIVRIDSTKSILSNKDFILKDIMKIVSNGR